MVNGVTNESLTNRNSINTGQNYNNQSRLNDPREQHLSRSGAFKLRLLRLQSDHVSTIADNVIDYFIRYLCSVPYHTKRNPDFVRQFRNALELLNDYRYNLQKENKKFAYSRPLVVLLTKYILLERDHYHYVQQRTRRAPPEKDVERKVLCLLQNLCGDPSKDNTHPHVSTVRALHTLRQVVTTDGENNGRFVDNMIRRLLGKLGLLAKFDNYHKDRNLLTKGELELLRSGANYDEVVICRMELDNFQTAGCSDDKINRKSCDERLLMPKPMKEEQNVEAAPATEECANGYGDTDLESYERFAFRNGLNDVDERNEENGYVSDDERLDDLVSPYRRRSHCTPNSLRVNHGNMCDKTSTKDSSYYMTYFSKVLDEHTLSNNRIKNKCLTDKQTKNMASGEIELDDDSDDDVVIVEVKQEKPVGNKKIVILNPQSIVLSSDDEEELMSSERVQTIAQINVPVSFNSKQNHDTSSNSMEKHMFKNAPETSINSQNINDENCRINVKSMNLLMKDATTINEETEAPPSTAGTEFLNEEDVLLIDEEEVASNEEMREEDEDRLLSENVQHIEQNKQESPRIENIDSSHVEVEKNAEQVDNMLLDKERIVESTVETVVPSSSENSQQIDEFLTEGEIVNSMPEPLQQIDADMNENATEEVESVDLLSDWEILLKTHQVSCVEEGPETELCALTIPVINREEFVVCTVEETNAMAVVNVIPQDNPVVLFCLPEINEGRIEEIGLLVTEEAAELQVVDEEFEGNPVATLEDVVVQLENYQTTFTVAETTQMVTECVYQSVQTLVLQTETTAIATTIETVEEETVCLYTVHQVTTACIHNVTVEPTSTAIATVAETESFVAESTSAKGSESEGRLVDFMILVDLASSREKVDLSPKEAAANNKHFRPAESDQDLAGNSGKEKLNKVIDTKKQARVYKKNSNVATRKNRKSLAEELKICELPLKEAIVDQGKASESANKSRKKDSKQKKTQKDHMETTPDKEISDSHDESAVADILGPITPYKPEKKNEEKCVKTKATIKEYEHAGEDCSVNKEVLTVEANFVHSDSVKEESTKKTSVKSGRRKQIRPFPIVPDEKCFKSENVTSPSLKSVSEPVAFNSKDVLEKENMEKSPKKEQGDPNKKSKNKGKHSHDDYTRFINNQMNKQAIETTNKKLVETKEVDMKSTAIEVNSIEMDKTASDQRYKDIKTYKRSKHKPESKKRSSIDILFNQYIKKKDEKGPSNGDESQSTRKQKENQRGDSLKTLPCNKITDKPQQSSTVPATKLNRMDFFKDYEYKKSERDKIENDTAPVNTVNSLRSDVDFASGGVKKITIESSKKQVVVEVMPTVGPFRKRKHCHESDGNEPKAKLQVRKKGIHDIISNLKQKGNSLIATDEKKMEQNCKDVSKKSLVVDERTRKSKKDKENAKVSENRNVSVCVNNADIMQTDAQPIVAVNSIEWLEKNDFVHKELVVNDPESQEKSIIVSVYPLQFATDNTKPVDDCQSVNENGIDADIKEPQEMEPIETVILNEDDLVVKESIDNVEKDTSNIKTTIITKELKHATAEEIVEMETVNMMDDLQEQTATILDSVASEMTMLEETDKMVVETIVAECERSLNVNESDVEVVSEPVKLASVTLVERMQTSDTTVDNVIEIEYKEVNESERHVDEIGEANETDIFENCVVVEEVEITTTEDNAVYLTNVGGFVEEADDELNCSIVTDEISVVPQDEHKIVEESLSHDEKHVGSVEEKIVPEQIVESNAAEVKVMANATNSEHEEQDEICEIVAEEGKKTSETKETIPIIKEDALPLDNSLKKNLSPPIAETISHNDDDLKEEVVRVVQEPLPSSQGVDNKRSCLEIMAVDECPDGVRIEEESRRNETIVEDDGNVEYLQVDKENKHDDDSNNRECRESSKRSDVAANANDIGNVIDEKSVTGGELDRNNTEIEEHHSNEIYMSNEIHFDMDRYVRTEPVSVTLNDTTNFSDTLKNVTAKMCMTTDPGLATKMAKGELHGKTMQNETNLEDLSITKNTAAISEATLSSSSILEVPCNANGEPCETVVGEHAEVVIPNGVDKSKSSYYGSGQENNDHEYYGPADHLVSGKRDRDLKRPSNKDGQVGMIKSNIEVALEDNDTLYPLFKTAIRSIMAEDASVVGDVIQVDAPSDYVFNERDNQLSLSFMNDDLNQTDTITIDDDGGPNDATMSIATSSAATTLLFPKIEREDYHEDDWTTPSIADNLPPDAIEHYDHYETKVAVPHANSWSDSYVAPDETYRCEVQEFGHNPPRTIRVIDHTPKSRPENLPPAVMLEASETAGSIIVATPTRASPRPNHGSISINGESLRDPRPMDGGSEAKEEFPLTSWDLSDIDGFVFNSSEPQHSQQQLQQSQPLLNAYPGANQPKKTLQSMWPPTVSKSDLINRCSPTADLNDGELSSKSDHQKAKFNHSNHETSTAPKKFGALIDIYNLQKKSTGVNNNNGNVNGVKRKKANKIDYFPVRVNSRSPVVAPNKKLSPRLHARSPFLNSNANTPTTPSSASIASSYSSPPSSPPPPSPERSSPTFNARSYVSDVPEERMSPTFGARADYERKVKALKESLLLRTYMSPVIEKSTINAEPHQFDDYSKQSPGSNASSPLLGSRDWSSLLSNSATKESTFVQPSLSQKKPAVEETYENKYDIIKLRQRQQTIDSRVTSTPRVAKPSDRHRESNAERKRRDDPIPIKKKPPAGEAGEFLQDQSKTRQTSKTEEKNSHRKHKLSESSGNDNPISIKKKPPVRDAAEVLFDNMLKEDQLKASKTEEKNVRSAEATANSRRKHKISESSGSEELDPKRSKKVSFKFDNNAEDAAASSNTKKHHQDESIQYRRDLHAKREYENNRDNLFAPECSTFKRDHYNAKDKNVLRHSESNHGGTGRDMPNSHRMIDNRGRVMYRPSSSTSMSTTARSSYPQSLRREPHNGRPYNIAIKEPLTKNEQYNYHRPPDANNPKSSSMQTLPRMSDHEATLSNLRLVDPKKNPNAIRKYEMDRYDRHHTSHPYNMRYANRPMPAKNSNSNNLVHACSNPKGHYASNAVAHNTKKYSLPPQPPPLRIKIGTGGSGNSTRSNSRSRVPTGSAKTN